MVIIVIALKYLLSWYIVVPILLYYSWQVFYSFAEHAVIRCSIVDKMHVIAECEYVRASAFVWRDVCDSYLNSSSIDSLFLLFYKHPTHTHNSSYTIHFILFSVLSEFSMCPFSFDVIFFAFFLLLSFLGGTNSPFLLSPLFGLYSSCSSIPVWYYSIIRVRN